MTEQNQKCIWYISKYVCPAGYDGTGTRAFYLMQNIAKKNYEAVIISSDSNHCVKVPEIHSNAMTEKINGVHFHWIKTLKYVKTNSVKRILSWLDFELKLFLYDKKNIPRPDAIIISSLSLLTILNGLLLKKKYKTKLIFEIRDIWPLTLVEEGRFSKYNPFIIVLSLIEKLGYKHSDRIVGTMPNLSEHVESLGIKKKAYCIPMGIEDDTIKDIKPLPKDYIRDYIPRNKFIISHLGSIGLTNAIDNLLNCATKMQSYENIHFLIVGVGDLLESLREKYSNLHNVTFAPRVEKEMVPSILERCDLTYFTTVDSKVWRYGQSLNKIIDYMHNGKPIVAEYSGYPSMINESKCGVFIKNEDIDCLEDNFINFYNMDRKKLIEIGNKGKDWLIHNRKYNKLADKYLELIF